MTDEETQAPQLTPTSAADWPATGVPEGTVVTLPSGAVARLREPPLQYLLATGRVPPKLWAKMQEVGVVLLLDPLKHMGKAEIVLFLDWMIAESFIEPAVSTTRRAGAVYIGDVSEGDKNAVMEAVGLSLMG